MCLAVLYRSSRPSALPPPPGYVQATRHPLPCLLFLLPLLAAYEAGVIWLGGDQADLVRNGADAWLRWLLEAFGLQQLYWAPLLLVAGLLAWAWARRDDRPGDLLGVCSGMALESVAFALVLWRLSQELGPLLDRLGIQLATAPPRGTGLARLVTFVGAGIYEESLFRLALFCGLAALLRMATVPRGPALAVAAVAAALAFAGVHHVGPYGETFDAFVFLFRTLAGLYFTALLLCRGFGVAVGAHVCYDVIVGIRLG